VAAGTWGACIDTHTFHSVTIIEDAAVHGSDQFVKDISCVNNCVCFKDISDDGCSGSAGFSGGWKFRLCRSSQHKYVWLALSKLQTPVQHWPPQ
jgi:hypothetical protein